MHMHISALVPVLALIGTASAAPAAALQGRSRHTVCLSGGQWQNWYSSLSSVWPTGVAFPTGTEAASESASASATESSSASAAPSESASASLDPVLIASTIPSSEAAPTSSEAASSEAASSEAAPTSTEAASSEAASSEAASSEAAPTSTEAASSEAAPTSTEAAASSEAASSSEVAPTSTEAAASSSEAPAPSASASESASSSSSSDPQEQVALHNAFRASYGAGALTWSDELATFAQSVADKCVFEHSGGAYGENLAAGVGGSYTQASGFQSWANEASQYDWNNPGFSSATGHFTQVVWKATTEIGCAIASCADGTIFSGMQGQQSTYLVCEYRAPGNVVSDDNQYFKDNVGTYQG